MGRALVVEGGGMKGAYANGVLTAFERAGLRSWDALYGTSAGGALVAWFGARQAEFAEGTWNYAADPRILSYRRMLRGGPLLNHEALLDVVYQAEHRLDVEALQRSEFPVTVTASRLRDGAPDYHDLRRGSVIPWLKATGRLPFSSGPPVPIDGELYLDGGITDPIPVRKAVADGHRDVTVVLNMPVGRIPRDSPALARLLARRYPTLSHGLLHHAEIKQDAVDYAMHPPPGVRIHIVRPAGPTGLHRLSRDLQAIRRAIALGRSDGAAYVARRDAEGTAP